VATLRVPIRAGAVSLAVGGVIVAVLLPLHPSIFDRPIGEVVADTPLWTLIHAAGLVVFPLAVLGAAAIVAAHGDRAGRLGRVGLVVTLLGTFGGMGLAAVETVAFPAIAGQAPELLALDGPIVASWGFILLGVLALGWPLGLSTIGLGASRAGVFPRAPGVVLAIAGPAWLLFAGPFVPIADVLASALFGGAQVWWAVMLWRAGAVRNSGGAELSSRG
jgi:hypothetical protein